MSYKNKEVREAYMKKYRQDHRDALIKWRKDNPEHGKMIYKNRIEYLNKWKKDNAGKMKSYRKKWDKKNPEYQKEYQEGYQKKCGKTGYRKEYSKQYRKNNIKRIRRYSKQYEKTKRKTDIKFKLNSNFTRAIAKSLKGNKAGRHWEDLVGYTLKDLIKHLKKNLPKGYIWQDYLDGKLHLDHKIPKSIFNFSKPEHFDFRRCWALSNLQLLPAKENLIKHTKLIKPFQPSLKITSQL